MTTSDTIAPDLSDTANCPVRNIVDRIGDRWSLLVISALAHGKRARFSDIKRQIGDISPRMLSQTLRRLEQDGYVVRTAYPTVPVKVEYCLTDLGRSLLDPLGNLIAWANEYFHLILQARKAYTPPPPNAPL